MTNKKSTKRALLTSVLALVLCLSMLVGTTFAWFTDSVTSGVNKITAGNLDVELEYYTDSEWKTVSNATELFTDELWEPGHTEVVYLRLTNLGNLAVKYQLGINIVSETKGTNVYGDTFKLSDYIYMGVVEDKEPSYATREEAVAAVDGTGIISTGYTKVGTMTEQDEVLYLALVVYMPETVGNEANYLTGTTAPQIDLGINVVATQYTYEKDSWDETYDENAGLYSTIVTSEEELVAALAEAKNGDIIGISGNVTWTTGASPGSTPFVTDATYITLQGVDENATFTAVGQGVGPVGIDNGTVIFKDLTIADQSVSYAENSWEFGYLEFRGNTVFENCDVVNAIMMSGDSAVFTNCSFNSNADSEYAVWVDSGDASFENCYFTGTRGVKVHEAYGSEVGTVVINNSTFADLSKKPGLAVGDVNEDTTITVTNNLFVDTQAGDQGNYKYESDTDVTTFDFTDENNTVIADATVIDSAEELLALSNQKLEGTIVLTADIDLQGESIQSIGAAYGKSLTVIGNGHTISNADLAAGTHNGMDNYGLFYAYTDSTLKISNLVIENVTVEATGDNYGAAVVVGYMDGNSNVTLTNVDVKNSNIKNAYDEAAVYVSYQTGTLVMTDCDSTGCTVEGETAEKTGAFIGCANGTATLNNCTTDLTIGVCNRILGTVNVNGGWIPVAADSAESLNDALSNGTDVVLTKSISDVDSGKYYGNASSLVNMTNGGTLDGNGNTIAAKDEWDDTYDTVIYTTGGTIKNVTIDGAMRGIFSWGLKEDLIIDNVIFNDVVYTVNDDASNGYAIKVTNSVLNGWTSWTSGHSEISFTDCSFGFGMGYGFINAHQSVTFTNCEFAEDFEINPANTSTYLTFVNCTYNGVLITEENVADVLYADSDTYLCIVNNG